MKADFEVGNKVEKKPVLFDRCVKVEFGTSRAGANKVLTIEYNPQYADKYNQRGSLCTRIEGTVTDIPKINNKTRTPGFTATIRIYNDNGDIAAECAKRSSIITDFASQNVGIAQQRNAFREFIQNKLWATIYVGYWDGEKADYTQIFSGLIQSNYSYRKGTDLITELQCSDVRIEDISQDQMALYFDSGPNAIKTQKEESDGVIKVWQPNQRTWDSLANLAIQLKSKQKARKVTDWIQMTVAPEEVTSSDRERTGWWEINYDDNTDINLSADAVTPQEDGSPIRKYYSQTNDFDSIWGDLLAIFPNGNVGCKIEDDNVRGVRVYNIYRLGKRGTPRREGKNIYHVYDYQNLLDAPMLGTTSGLNVNMILRPEIKAGNYLQLDLSDDARKNLGVSVGINTTGNSQFTSFLQGEKSQVAKAQGAKNGTIFNTPFLIYKVVHTFSTHGNNWKTSVTTVPEIFKRGS